MTTLYHGDCLIEMSKIADKSIDMICTDLPFGTTKCGWDTIIPFTELWLQYQRIIKDNGAIVLFGTEPFSSHMRLSNIKMYKYDWIWIKSRPIGFMNVKKMPLKNVEIISVFYKNLPTYNPQSVIKIDKKRTNDNSKNGNNETGISGHNGGKMKGEYIQEFTNYPNQILYYGSERGLHQTQKPVSLIEYLIATYSNEGDMILDSCMGSGTAGIASKNLNRNFIGIEKDETYFNIAKNRIEQA